jgi:F-type H+-transporting ATPase subunit gamma
LATLREIKSRISSVKSTEKITRAMKMVASVKFRKAQQNVLQARPYARKINDILRSLIPSIENLDNELLKEREVKKVCFIVVAADRGLCGSFNTNLVKSANSYIKENLSGFNSSGNLTMITLGRKTFDHFSKRNFDIYAKFSGIFDKLDFASAQSVIKEIVSGYVKKDFDKVVVMYNEFKNVVQSKIVTEQLLPIQRFEQTEAEENRNDAVPMRQQMNVSNYIFEPSIEEIISTMLPRHLNTQVWRILLESYASEQAARMTAMDSATSNANDLVATLQLTYNRARQAAITKEILEVVGGAEALNEAN